MAVAAVQQDDLVARLKADHLADEIELAQQPNPGQPDNPKHKLVYPFDFRWTDGRGKVWEGRFVNKILSLGERQAQGVLQARFSVVPIERHSLMTNEINLMVSHLHYSLKEKPEWAQDLQALHDVNLLQAIYLEVASHEATFFGLEPAPGGSEA